MSKLSQISRRDFIKLLALSGYFLARPGKILRADEFNFSPLDCEFRTMSVKHLAEMQRQMDIVLSSGKISNHETFQRYIQRRSFSVPDDFQDAKTIIVLAKFTNYAQVKFHYNGETIPVNIPHQYWDDGVTMEQLMDFVQKKIIKSDGYRVENSRTLFLKRLTAHSGLGKYGRNNIIYTDRFGSYISLFAFFTDWESPDDHFGEIETMDLCESCNICLKRCPTGAIRENEFIIDAGKCLSLFNEVDLDFPEWIPKSAHNALMGCTRCQEKCPYNHKVVSKPVILDDVSEEETNQILTGIWNEEMMEKVSKTLKDYYPSTDEKYFPIFQKNLSVLLE